MNSVQLCWLNVGSTFKKNVLCVALLPAVSVLVVICLPALFRFCFARLLAGSLVRFLPAVFSLVRFLLGLVSRSWLGAIPGAFFLSASWSRASLRVAFGLAAFCVALLAVSPPFGSCPPTVAGWVDGVGVSFPFHGLPSVLDRRSGSCHAPTL